MTVQTAERRAQIGESLRRYHASRSEEQKVERIRKISESNAKTKAAWTDEQRRANNEACSKGVREFWDSSAGQVARKAVGERVSKAWAEMSEDEREAYLANSFHSEESKEKFIEASKHKSAETCERISESVKAYFAGLSDKGYAELCERNSRSACCERSSFGGRRRGYTVSMTEERRREANDARSAGMMQFWASPVGAATKIAIAERVRQAWAGKSEEEKLEWLGKSLHSEVARMDIGAKVSRGLYRYWAGATSGERDQRYRSWLAGGGPLNTVKGNRGRPTQPEQAMWNTLEEYFPGKWGYNGDGSQGVAIGGCVPDFVRLDGTKEVVEVFGEYWHGLEDEVLKVEHYLRKGYKCLVVWDFECGLGEGVLRKLQAFGVSSIDESSI